MFRASLLLLLSFVAGACGTLQSSGVDETNTPRGGPEETRTARPATATSSANANADSTETPAPSSTPDPDFIRAPTGTAAAAAATEPTPARCPTDPTPDPVVAATEAAMPSNTPDPDFVPNYAATATAEVVGTVPSGEPYCPPGNSAEPPPRATSTPGVAPTPLPAGSLTPLTFSPGAELLASDLYARGNGTPGRGAFNVARIAMARIGVDSAVARSYVGADGQMPSPAGLFDVYWYDFSGWQSLGGLPGAGGNAIFAGSVGEPGVRGVFNDVYTLVAGDAITVVLLDGRSLTYRVEFNKIASATIDWTSIVSATADESLTIITGSNNRVDRRILWARRVQ